MGNKNKTKNAIRQNINDLTLPDLKFKDFIKKDVLIIKQDTLQHLYYNFTKVYNILKRYDFFDIGKIQKSKNYYEFICNVSELLKEKNLEIYEDYHYGIYLKQMTPIEMLHDVGFMYLGYIEKSPYKNWIKKGIWYLIQCGFSVPYTLRDVIAQKEEMITCDDDRDNEEDQLKELNALKESYNECDYLSELTTNIAKIKIINHSNIEKSKVPSDLKLWFKSCQLLYKSGFNIENVDSNIDEYLSLSERYVFLENENSYTTEAYSEHLQMCFETVSFEVFKTIIIDENKIRINNDYHLAEFLLLIFDIDFKTGTFFNLHSKQTTTYGYTLQTMENLVNLPKRKK